MIKVHRGKALGISKGREDRLGPPILGWLSEDRADPPYQETHLPVSACENLRGTYPI
jgi:hypothetical protein